MFDFITKLFKAPFDSIDVAAYKNDYFKKNNHVLIDVRSAQEFKGGHVPNAKNIPLDSLSKQVNKIPKDKTVIVICQSGMRSASACKTLIAAGYSNVLNLRGGTSSWQMQANPVERG